MLNLLQNLRFIDIIAGIVVIACLVFLFQGKDHEIIGILVGILTAYGAYKGANRLMNKNRK